VRFWKRYADTVYYVQQMRPDELDAASPVAAEAAAAAAAAAAASAAGAAGGAPGADDDEAMGAGVGVGKILRLGAGLRRELEALARACRAVPDYAAAFGDDAEFEARVAEITGAERAAPEAALLRGIEAGEQRLANIDAVLAAATRIALAGDASAAGAGGAGGAGGDDLEALFSGIEISGPGGDLPLIYEGAGARADTAAAAALAFASPR